MRPLIPVGSAALAVAATVLLAPAAFADAPGDNGTIKIHDAKTGEELRKNEPHVCSFYLDAFGFDGQQQAGWKIVDQPPTGHDATVAASGDITLDGSGHGRTDDTTLPDGHYKLLWNFDGEHGKAKQKVFWVDCTSQAGTSGATTSGGTTGDTTGGSTTGTPTSGGTTGGAASGGTSGSGGSTGSGGSSGSSTTGGDTGTGGSGSLAETGASVIGVSASAAVLLAVGGTILYRRRAGRQH